MSTAPAPIQPSHSGVWPAIARYALLGLLIAVLLVLLDLAYTSTNPLNLVQPGDQGPSVALFRKDFPGQELL